jgi:DNA-binding NarL/FixJ family response regulator
MSERRARVLLADDHPMILEGLRKLLETDLDVVGVATNGRALLEAAEIWRPDLVIADISMPGIDGIEVTRRLRETVPETWVLILSVHTEPSWVRAAFAAGAHAYLTKSSAPEEIENAVREVLLGHFYLSPSVTPSVLGLAREGAAERFADAWPAASEALTPRELDIVRLVGKGLANKEIARSLGVAVTTVRTHLSKVYDKLGPGTRVALALFARNAGGTAM